MNKSVLENFVVHDLLEVAGAMDQDQVLMDGLGSWGKAFVAVLDEAWEAP